LRPHRDRNPDAEFKIVVFVPEANSAALRAELSAAGAGVIGNYSQCSFASSGEGTFFGNDAAEPAVGSAGQLEHAAELRLEMLCPAHALPGVAAAVARVHPYEEPAWDVYPLAAKPDPSAGSGREIELAQAIGIDELILRVKQHLGLERVRLAKSDEHARGAPISRIAACAGAGGSAFEGVHGADVFLTGEMRHHEVLARVAQGKSVILCGHTNTERGYLPRFRERLIAATRERIEVRIASSDREPLCIV
jgi:hypothetical protein